MECGNFILQCIAIILIFVDNENSRSISLLLDIVSCMNGFLVVFMVMWMVDVNYRRGVVIPFVKVKIWKKKCPKSS